MMNDYKKAYSNQRPDSQSHWTNSLLSTEIQNYDVKFD